VLDELGLVEEFLRVPHQEMTELGVTTDDGTYVVAGLGCLPGAYPFLASVPQWDLLDFLVDHAQRYPQGEPWRKPSTDGPPSAPASRGATCYLRTRLDALR
jgi:hypothetical protein